MTLYEKVAENLYINNQFAFIDKRGPRSYEPCSVCGHPKYGVGSPLCSAGHYPSKQES